ncbi:hypothetical protein PPROV_000722400 [Pycnococcus provasolii]|uniref:ABC transporter domain-containing protein n=1 Tax=Pycnococcus provasolii TaxID=41880 RepID=A0A830HM50_9CHLO|nr:hypothetical protein PPROV_000722400 [Pycnococcus provasolii]
MAMLRMPPPPGAHQNPGVLNAAGGIGRISGGAVICRRRPLLHSLRRTWGLNSSSSSPRLMPLRGRCGSGVRRGGCGASPGDGVPLITVRDLSFSHDGVRSQVEDMQLVVSRGERIGVVGPNGAGKSTVLRLLAGVETITAGTVELRRGASTAFLQQTVDADAAATAVEYLWKGEGEKMKALRAYEAAASSGDANQIADSVTLMNDADAWGVEANAREMLERLGCDWDEMKNTPFSRLSAGQRKRVAIASSLLANPDVIFMDEPTTHLSVEAIEWLENRIVSPPPDQLAPPAMLIVSHDRWMLDKVCTSILEVDGGGGTYRHAGNYDDFVNARELRWQAALNDQSKAKTLLRKEREWMRRQPKARETKSVAREAAYYELEERAGGGGAGGEAAAASRALSSKMDLTAEGVVQSTRLGDKVLSIKQARLQFGDDGKKILDDFSYSFQRGDRVAIVGPNGVGKSTLLSILMKNTPLDAGEVDVGETVQIGHFDQEPSWGDDGKLRVCDFVKSEVATRSGGAFASSQLPKLMERFNFTSGRQDTRIEDLSGGEQRRLQLMNVLAEQPNFLMVDEPTNELDIATIEAFEDVLTEFPGVVVGVSHDRRFLDSVFDTLIVLEGDGRWKVFTGSYSEYRKLKEQETAAAVKRDTDDSKKEEEEEDSGEKKKVEYADRKAALRAQSKMEKTYKKVEEAEVAMQKLDDEMTAAGNDLSLLEDLQARRDELESSIETMMMELEELEEMVVAAGLEPAV